MPRFAETEEFLHPVGRENEWPVNAAFAKATRETGILASKSPFVLQSIVFRVELETYEGVIAGRFTPAEGARVMAERINAEIADKVLHAPKLHALYEERLETQRRIEARRAEGRPVPAAWVTDAFHTAYYRAHGWLETEAKP